MAKIWEILKEDNVGLEYRCELGNGSTHTFIVANNNNNKIGLVSRMTNDGTISYCDIDICTREIMYLDFVLIEQDLLKDRISKELIINNIDKQLCSVPLITLLWTCGVYKKVYIHSSLKYIMYKGRIYNLDVTTGTISLYDGRILHINIGWKTLSNFKVKRKKGVLVYDDKSGSKNL